MTGFTVWSRKELLEIWRTWRRYVLPLLFLIMAVFSPVMARITPELVRSFSSNDPGVVIELPDPTAVDALNQWGQSLGQIVLIAVIVIAAGLVSGDLTHGAGQLALVKPLSRRDYILAKVVILAGFLAALTIVATVICGLATYLLFSETQPRRLIEISAVWLLLAFLFIGIQTLLSTVLHSQTAAAGAGIAIYFALSLMGLWAPLKRFTPAGLISSFGDLSTGSASHLAVPIASAILAGIICLGVAIALFQRQSIR